MISLKDTIFVIKKKIKKIFFLSFFHGTVEKMDQKLVYSLSDHKIPNFKQLKYINRFLSSKEYWIVKICLFLIAINLIYLGGALINKHLVYTPDYGGEYIEGIVSHLSSTNPLYAVQGANADVSKLLYSSLFRYDDKGGLQKDLVDSYEINDKGKEFVIKLKDNIKWHDDIKLTADDVVYTFNTIKNKDYKSPLRESLIDTKIEKIDERTIKITLKNPSVSFLDVLTFGIIPKHIWEHISPDKMLSSDFNIKAIGSGPYKFKSLVKSRLGYLKEYHLVANEKYFGHKPYLQNVIFKFYYSYIEAIDALNNNQIDGLSGMPFQEKESILGQNSLSFHELEKAQIISIFFNNKNNEQLKDKNVRKALAFAIDRESISNSLYDNTYKLVNGPILNTSFVYNNNLSKVEYDIDKARELLGDKKVSIKLSVTNNNIDLAKRIKYYWNKIGVDTEIIIIPQDKIKEVIKNHGFEAFIYGQNVGGDPDIYVFWHSSQIDNGFNLALYNNKQVDSLLAKARVEVDLNKRIEDYKKIQEIIVSDYPVIFLYIPSYSYLQSKQIKGFSGTTIIEESDRLSNIDNWYKKTSKKFVW